MDPRVPIELIVGNEPAIVVFHHIALTPSALPASQLTRLKVAIVHKVTLMVTIISPYMDIAIAIDGPISIAKSNVCGCGGGVGC